MEDLKPLLPKHIQSVINSGDSVSKISQPLKSVLEMIPIPENALKVLEGINETLKDVSSLWCTGFPKLSTDKFAWSSIH